MSFIFHTLPGPLLEHFKNIDRILTHEILEYLANNHDYVNHTLQQATLTENETLSLQSQFIVFLNDHIEGQHLQINDKIINDWSTGSYFEIDNGDKSTIIINNNKNEINLLHVTCSKVDIRDVFSKAHWFNIEGLETKQSSKIKSLNNLFFKMCKIPRDKPCIVYLLNGNITELDEMILDQTSIDYCNNQGLDIYLYEPLCSSSSDIPEYYKFNNSDMTMMFYSEFKGSESLDTFYAKELDSIANLVKNNNLTNVKVHTCDYQAKTFHNRYENLFDIQTNDIFVKTIGFPEKKNSPTQNFSKRFVSLNWRYTPHRHLLMTYMCRLEGYYSWYFTGNLNNLLNKIWIDNRKWPVDILNNLIEGTEILNSTVPLEVDLSLNKKVHIQTEYAEEAEVFLEYRPADEKNMSNKLEEAYADIFCDVVAETRFAQPCGNFSEKLLRPIYYKKPFLLLAPPYTLRYLREQGYRTFNKFWDESYDECTDHQQRMIQVFKLIDYIQSRSIEQLQELYREMLPTLNFNYYKFLTESKHLCHM